MKITDKIYGSFEINDNLAEDIIKTKAMQRLKGISQYSTYFFVSPHFNTTRFEHCIGVYLLLKKLGASREEQIAGLIHDVAHTAFSHVIDFVYDKGITQDAHEDFHERIVNESEIPELFKKYGMNIDYILNEKNFPLLEKDIPDLCADRMDYFMRDIFTVKKFPIEKIKKYLNSFAVFNNEIIIKDKESAKEIAEGYMNMDNDFWGKRFVPGSFKLLANALRLALKDKLITEDDFFLTDKELFEKLEKSNNAEILKITKLVKKYETFAEGTPEDHDMFEATKKRFIDPKILKDGKLTRLSDIDNEFKKKLENYKNAKKEFFIKIIKGE